MIYILAIAAFWIAAKLSISAISKIKWKTPEWTIKAFDQTVLTFFVSFSILGIVLFYVLQFIFSLFKIIAFVWLFKTISHIAHQNQNPV